MRLQQKVYGFSLQSGDNPKSKLLTSKLAVNEKLSEILVSDLFIGIKKEKNGTIKGYSILEFVDENGNIKVNDKIYNLSFAGNEETFVLKSVADPRDYTLEDKNVSDSDLKSLEEKIESSAPVSEPTQPKEPITQLETVEAVVEDSVYTNEEYEQEKNDLSEEGFVEYNTEPRSNNRALIKTSESGKQKIVLIEITKDDYNILNMDEHEFELNNKNKTITINKLVTDGQ